jgi:carboxypeptidase Q
MLRRKLTVVFLLYAIFLPGLVFGQTTTTAPATTTTTTATVPAVKVYTAPKETIDRIKEEGLKNSQVMQTLSYLTDVIGGRLTGSPNMKRSNEWTRDTMKKWGLQNANVEAWGNFGRGWSLKSFSAQIVEPQVFPVIAYPKAWSPSTKGVVTSEVVYLDVKTEADFAKYKGKLAGKIVLLSPVREVKADFKGMGTRRTDEELAKLANAPDPATIVRPQQNQQQQMTPQQTERLQRIMTTLKAFNFLIEEGAAATIDNSFEGSGGTLFVQSANPAQEVPANPQDLFRRGAFRLMPYQKEAEAKMIPQLTMASEDYNRLLRMIQQGVTPKMTLDVQTQYHDEDTQGYNTIAEIPGTDPTLKDEIVMLGGHMDSWHSSTGATDNAAGVAVAMEAVRILQSLGLKPRRTIRVALWSGEEQGLLGSRGYVKNHFGEWTGEGEARTLTRKPAYDKFSAYYNLDNGTGKIRGVYMQGNSAVAPLFRSWLEPFKELGATTLTLSNTGGTDHLAFDAIGLPGFQFIQDEIEYDARTHHSNQDNYDRIQAEDMKQAATIMAAFVYQTAMMDEKIPRKVVK